MNVKTVLFDMDGVVLDSEKLHLRALGMTLKQNGIDYSEEILNEFAGRSDTSFFVYAKEKLDDRVNIEEFIRQKNTLYFSFLPELRFIEGFQDFIRTVLSKKIRTALVTSSSRYSVRKADEILNFTRFFDTIIAEEDTATHKPNPEPYLMGLERIKAEKDSTIIIEDSVNGILAGKAAGCTVCGLTTSFESGVLSESGADFVFRNYDEISTYFFR